MTSYIKTLKLNQQEVSMLFNILRDSLSVMMALDVSDNPQLQATKPLYIDQLNGLITKVLEEPATFGDPPPTDEVSDPCPDCGNQLKDASGGGVKCACGYWFCY